MPEVYGFVGLGRGGFVNSFVVVVVVVVYRFGVVSPLWDISYRREQAPHGLRWVQMGPDMEIFVQRWKAVRIGRDGVQRKEGKGCLSVICTMMAWL
jgi:hypothetical protein